MFLKQLVYSPKNIAGQNDLVVDTGNDPAAFQIGRVGCRQLHFGGRLNVGRRRGIKQLLCTQISSVRCERNQNEKTEERAHSSSAPNRTNKPVRQRTGNFAVLRNRRKSANSTRRGLRAAREISLPKTPQPLRPRSLKAVSKHLCYQPRE